MVVSSDNIVITYIVMTYVVTPIFLIIFHCIVLSHKVTSAAIMSHILKDIIK